MVGSISHASRVQHRQTPHENPYGADSVSEAKVLVFCGKRLTSFGRASRLLEFARARFALKSRLRIVNHLRSSESRLLNVETQMRDLMHDLLGIISDTHGQTRRARRAIELLVGRGATRIIHLGDVGNESILDLLAGIESTVVFGNCDDEHSLARYAQHLGIHVIHPGAIIEIKECRIGITHGHIDHVVKDLLGATVDVLLHGHTHEIRDDRVGATRILNPGALHRATRYTAMLLDPCTGHAEWIDVDADVVGVARTARTGSD